MVVGSQSVNVGVMVGENPCLQHLVRRNGDAWYHVAGTEGGLLHLCKVIDRVAVQHQLAYFDGRDLSVRPDLGDIEDVPREIFGLLRCQNLHLKRPGRVIPTLNGLVQVTGRVIGVGPSDVLGLLPGEILDTLVRLEMVLHPEVLALVIVPLEGVAAVAIHVSIGSWCSPAREKNRDLMNGFRCQGQEVPERSPKVRLEQRGRCHP